MSIALRLDFLTFSPSKVRKAFVNVSSILLNERDYTSGSGRIMSVF